MENPAKSAIFTRCKHLRLGSSAAAAFTRWRGLPTSPNIVSRRRWSALGRYRGRKARGAAGVFSSRHGRGHRILPHELNHRANIHALRSLGVRWILCVTAVGSLQEEYAPRHIVLPSQFFDRTSQAAAHTFFGGGIAAHVSFAEPTCAPLRHLLANAARELGFTVHNGGTYVNMDGPAFSTRAESETHRKLGFDVIGMTNLEKCGSLARPRSPSPRLP